MAPYLATKCLQKLAQEGEVKYPLGAKILAKDFYVDDVITEADNLTEVLEIQQQLTKLLKEGGFELRKWCGNHPRLLAHIPPENQELQINFNDCEDQQIKTLGLTWHPKNDNFSVKINRNENTRVTKRTVASDIAKLFDPLGILSPVIVSAKIFLQELWQLKLEWDEELPLDLRQQWHKFQENLNILENFQIPRRVLCNNINKQAQLHTFADASERAYGAAVYIRSVDKGGQVSVRLLCSKTRVAPIKKITLPRLELCACELAVELTERVRHATSTLILLDGF